MRVLEQKVCSDAPAFVVGGRGTYWTEPINFFRFDPDEMIYIGSFCSIASNTTFIVGGAHKTSLVSTFPFMPSRTYNKGSGKLIVKNDVWIGHGASIVGYPTIENGAVVGSSSLVIKDVPPYAIVCGNPARVVRYRFKQKIIDDLLEIRWWAWDDIEIEQRREWFYKPVEAFIEAFKSGSGVRTKQEGRIRRSGLPKVCGSGQGLRPDEAVAVQEQ